MTTDSADPASATVQCDAVQYDRNRAAVLEYLFQLDGRDKDEHPYAHTYTNLIASYQQKIGELVLDEITRGWHQDQQPVILVDFRDAGRELEP